jgi:hypothetical protein
MRQGTSWIYLCIPDLPQHVSAGSCHLQGVVGALEATQVISVLWVNTDKDPFGVTSCLAVCNNHHLRNCLARTIMLDIIITISGTVCARTILLRRTNSFKSGTVCARTMLLDIIISISELYVHELSC